MAKKSTTPKASPATTPVVETPVVETPATPIGETLATPVEQKNETTSLSGLIRELVHEHKEKATIEVIEAFFKKNKIKYSPATVRTQLSLARKREGVVAERGLGIVKALRDAFIDLNIVTYAAMVDFVKFNNITAAPATVRTQVGKMRHEFKLTQEGSGRGRRNPDGPVAKIREAFENGIQTVPEMVLYLKKSKVVVAEATIKTQVGRLRKAGGLSNRNKIDVPAEPLTLQ